MEYWKNGIQKSMIMIILAIFLLSMAGVCASDADNAVMAGEDNGHSELFSNNGISEDNLQTSEDNHILAQANDDEMLGEPADLNELINGNQSKTYIELENDYHGSFDGGDGIQINRENVVIDGKGHTINCTGQNSRMFNVQKDGITFKNIIFTGGYSDCGGAIYTNNDLTVINCTFIDNRATSGAEGYGGGAIFAYDVKMSIYNCTFINNRAAKHGGAIAAFGGAPDDWEIFNCTFIDNAADEWGGAFYSHAD